MEPRESFAENGGFTANESVSMQISKILLLKVHRFGNLVEASPIFIQGILDFSEESGEHINAN
jgi:hypothetical protein